MNNWLILGIVFAVTSIALGGYHGGIIGLIFYLLYRWCFDKSQKG